MKKFLNMFFVVVIIFQIVAPTFAYGKLNSSIAVVSEDSDGVAVSGNDGNIMKFKTYEDGAGAILMDYFYNGELICTYNLSVEPGVVHATNVTGEEYIVDSYILDIAPEEDISPQALNERNLGTIFFNPTSNLTNPSITIMEGTLNAKRSTKKISTPAGEFFADATAFASSVFLGEALSKAVADIPMPPIQKITISLLIAMISDAGGEIVDGIITVALSKSYDIVILNKQLQAYNDGYSHKYKFSVVYSEYAGMMYKEDDYYSDYDIHPENWSSTRNATMMWADTYGQNGYVVCPGIKNILFYYD